MSWFKKLFSSQGSSSSQTPAVKFIKVTHKKDDEDDIKKEEPDTSNESEQSTQEIDQTQESSCYNWSGATSLFNSQGEKRKWVDYEETEEPWWESFKSQPSTQTSEEPWWESFKSQLSTQESTQESTQASNFELTQQSQSNQEKNENDDEDDEKVSF